VPAVALVNPFFAAAAVAAVVAAVAGAATVAERRVGVLPQGGRQHLARPFH